MSPHPERPREAVAHGALPGAPAVPRSGDLLVSRPTACVEHRVTVVPAPAVSTCPNHDTAVRRACEMARARHVDAWLTVDHIHFRQLACHREAWPGRSAGQAARPDPGACEDR
jgi:hypothetical protein